MHAVIDKQNELTSRVLARCEGRSQIKDLVSKIMDYPKRGLPWKRGGAPRSQRSTRVEARASPGTAHHSSVRGMCADER